MRKLIGKPAFPTGADCVCKAMIKALIVIAALAAFLWTWKHEEPNSISQTGNNTAGRDVNNAPNAANNSAPVLQNNQLTNSTLHVAGHDQIINNNDETNPLANPLRRVVRVW